MKYGIHRAESSPDDGRVISVGQDNIGDALASRRTGTFMSKPRQTPLSLVGLDIGGTKTHGLRWNGSEVCAEARSGSANVQNVSVETAGRNIAEVFAALGSGPIDRVVAGSGGIDTETDAESLRALIAVHAPGAEILVVHDTRLILAAGRAATGMAVILGTGSAAWGINGSGREGRAGGWGYLLGDEASGYWLGREAVRATLREFNRGQAPGELGRRVLAANKVESPDELIALFHGDTDRRYWAQQSPLVFEALAAGDPGSALIVAEAVEHVCGMLGDLAALLGLDGPVIIGGGVGTHQPVFQDGLRAALDAMGLGDIRFLEVDPVHGARFISDHTALPATAP
ncbi:N-acetylglucosamine kinase [Paeniglutamicibacter quisquiliarum]|uniref:N-acetylglucosamine kinase n=1 Tax=Paeniglutamicibacter quisquiliarum TaxID=2849498 RepID=UPI0020C3BF53|nr:BadF/BadG/BcrA/BcrD ATPase family protein [Paeniglutamicibacter quisquiliarum]